MDIGNVVSLDTRMRPKQDPRSHPAMKRSLAAPLVDFLSIWNFCSQAIDSGLCLRDGVVLEVSNDGPVVTGFLNSKGTGKSRGAQHNVRGVGQVTGLGRTRLADLSKSKNRAQWPLPRPLMLSPSS